MPIRIFLFNERRSFTIETEEQRRCWFATHPEYSWSHRGIRGRSGKQKNEDAIDPRDVDECVDNALQYASDEKVIALLETVKRNFVTQTEDCDNEPKDSGHAAAKRTTNDKHEGLHGGRRG